MISLTKDMKLRCTRANIKWKTWSSKYYYYYKRYTLINILLFIIDDIYASDNYQILFLAVEHISQFNIISYLNELDNKGKLSRIVIDECHLSIIWTDFRLVYNLLITNKGLNEFLLLLTATLPPYMEQKINLFFGNEFSVIRKTTERLNIKYQVIKDNNNNLDNTITTYLSSIITNLNTNERIIIFCSTINEVEELSLKINMNFTNISNSYHGKLINEDKEIIQNDWVQGKIQIIVATKAFGMGIDYPDISHIIHKGPSSSLIDYVQESGRAGRGGSTSLSIIFTSDDYNKNIIERFENNNNIEEVKRMINFINIKTCRRAYLGSYMDNEGYNCLLYPGCELCDNCLNEDSEEEITQ